MMEMEWSRVAITGISVIMMQVMGNTPHYITRRMTNASTRVRHHFFTHTHTHTWALRVSVVIFEENCVYV